MIVEGKKWNSVVASRGVEVDKIRRNTDEGRRRLCLGEEDNKHMLLDCLETGNWRMNFLSEKWLNVNKEVACRKALSCASKDQIRNVIVRYLDKVKCKWFNNTKEMKIIAIRTKW
jgi:hypothetical protein